MVKRWVQRVERSLGQVDPENAENYKNNADAYLVEIEKLEEWIREQVAVIPEEDRLLVTDHRVFGYFSEAFGFTQVGAIVPGYSSLSEPSAKELANLEDAVEAFGVKAVFVGNTVNPNLAQRLAEDGGTQLVFVFTGSLSEEGGEAESYIDYMRFNVRAIVDALQ